MAHKKGQGSSRNGRDSNAKRLGVKVYDGQTILSVLKRTCLMLTMKWITRIARSLILLLLYRKFMLGIQEEKRELTLTLEKL